MNTRGKKLEPKLGIKMPFGEILERLMQTDPKEVEGSIEKSKQANPELLKRPAHAPKVREKTKKQHE